jgi:hypothetical protein
MFSLKGKAFWIAFPLAVTAVSIFGVSRLRRHARPTSPPAATENAAAPVSAEANTPPPPAEATPAEAPTQAAPIVIPANTELAVRLNHPIGTDRVESGASFSATVADPVVVSGQTVIPAGAPVKGKVVYAHRAGRLKGVAEIRLALTSVEVEGNPYRLDTTTCTRVGQNHKKHNAEMIGGGAGAGALTGALVGHGKGALIGAPVGAAAGTGGAAFTEKRNLIIPAETAMTFRLLQPAR